MTLMEKRYFEVMVETQRSIADSLKTIATELVHLNNQNNK